MNYSQPMNVQVVLLVRQEFSFIIKTIKFIFKLFNFTIIVFVNS